MGGRGSSSGGGGSGSRSNGIRDAANNAMIQAGYDPINWSENPGISTMIESELNAGTPDAAIISAAKGLADASDMGASEINVFKVSDSFAASTLGAGDTNLLLGEISPHKTGQMFSGAAIGKTGDLYSVSKLINPSDIRRKYTYK